MHIQGKSIVQLMPKAFVSTMIKMEIRIYILKIFLKILFTCLYFFFVIVYKLHVFNPMCIIGVIDAKFIS